MRKVSIIILLCLQSAIVSAQSYLSLNIGPSLPIGEYSSTDPNDAISGFAELGISASLKYTRWLNSQKVGLMFDVGLTNNPFNEEEFAAGHSTSITADSYRAITVMPGILVGRYNEEWGSDVYGFVKLGMMSLTTPTIVSSSGGQQESIDSQSATGFGYGIGVGAHWTLAGNFGLSGTVEYVGGTARLDGYDQPIGNLNALLGLLLHF